MSVELFERLVDPNYEPEPTKDSEPCPYPAGSVEKIEFLARRVQAGEPLWNARDNRDIKELGD